MGVSHTDSSQLPHLLFDAGTPAVQAAMPHIYGGLRSLSLLFGAGALAILALSVQALIHAVTSWPAVQDYLSWTVVALAALRIAMGFVLLPMAARDFGQKGQILQAGNECRWLQMVDCIYWLLSCSHVAIVLRSLDLMWQTQCMWMQAVLHFALAKMVHL